LREGARNFSRWNFPAQKRKLTMPSFLNPRGFKNAMGEYPTVSVDDGWPEPHLVARPNDVLGQQIIDYAKRYRLHPAFPDSPWDARRGGIVLRDLDERRPDTDPIPRYRLREFGAVGPSVYSAGAELDYPGWPKNPSLLEPMNESASRVLDYMARVAPGRTLPGMPHSGGVLNLPSPSLFGTPQSATPRWAGNSAA
jgi:hypothetical protein